MPTRKKRGHRIALLFSCFNALTVFVITKNTYNHAAIIPLLPSEVKVSFFFTSVPHSMVQSLKRVTLLCRVMSNHSFIVLFSSYWYPHYFVFHSFRNPVHFVVGQKETRGDVLIEIHQLKASTDEGNDSKTGKLPVAFKGWDL